MFDTDQRSLPPVGWDHTFDPHPRPYQPGWRSSWFRRHRARPHDDEPLGQAALFTD